MREKWTFWCPVILGSRMSIWCILLLFPSWDCVKFFVRKTSFIFTITRFLKNEENFQEVAQNVYHTVPQVYMSSKIKLLCPHLPRFRAQPLTFKFQIYISSIFLLNYLYYKNMPQKEVHYSIYHHWWPYQN